MKKKLKWTEKNRAYVDSLPKIYLIGFWANWGAMELPFVGKFVYDEELKQHVPLVYDYDDHNGTEPAWYLRKITYTTTGQILTWTENKLAAELICSKLRK